MCKTLLIRQITPWAWHHDARQMALQAWANMAMHAVLTPQLQCTVHLQVAEVGSNQSMSTVLNDHHHAQCWLLYLW